MERHLASSTATSFMEPLGDSFSLFLLQVFVILAACRITSWALSKINLPAVVGEMVAGVILGPTVLGRIPGWSTTLFPSASMSILSTVATFGLCFFMFVRGDCGVHSLLPSQTPTNCSSSWLSPFVAHRHPFCPPLSSHFFLPSPAPRLLAWRWTLSRWPRVQRPPPC